MSELRKKFREEIAPQLQKGLGKKNVQSVPRLVKVVVNMGFGSGTDKDVQTSLAGDLKMLSGQRPVTTRAKRSISNFKLRQGMEIGARVTMRGVRMYDFIERLVHAALPRIRDFRGLSPTSFDGHGNYTFGVQDQTIFPEIDPDRVKQTQGMDVTIVTTAGGDDEALALLKALGLPIAEN